MPNPTDPSQTKETIKKLKTLISEYEQVEGLLSLDQSFSVGIPSSNLPLYTVNMSEIDVGRSALNTRLKGNLQQYSDHLLSKIKATSQSIASL